ncbi:uncharacterized protein PHALS_11632 [Plasmopara halstedii]|uniref:Uncharacterized protein n=1 Tax=Plasmopara halstedii TaxID=4781 RepID=A0A0P1AKV1_PLAHL|nr:uncharacterized protein PHALS_11632 [Plasmopara halstedii]CEG41274.1 hypothetical protein PHALS_11632 [Plasmopara halstedii]|eukprot:XP_024577643.1 hypothetical protein PHALS_11632 [Plasmopara halstedii]
MCFLRTRAQVFLEEVIIGRINLSEGSNVCFSHTTDGISFASRSSSSTLAGIQEMQRSGRSANQSREDIR